MADYSMKELKQWNEKIEEIVSEEGLDCYEQQFEIVSYEDMIGYETYIGMPSHYPHWSYGKTYERLKTLNRYNLTGLPYEMVINSDPCIAYLMKDNTLLLQILTMAHVHGHNDFFKNNRLFKNATRASYTIEMFKNHAGRIREYISDPGISYTRVERILNSAHALKLQTKRTAEEKKLSDPENIEKILKDINEEKSEHPLLEPKNKARKPLPDFKRIPLEPVEDILSFIIEYGKLNEWEKDIIDITRKETEYFIPQIETKIMNEGWASFFHYNILKKLDLPQDLYIEFIKRHNQVIRPHPGRINPYYLGFKMFEDIKERHKDNPGKIFEAREIERDQSFIRRYLTQDLCKELNLFQYYKNRDSYLISEVADEEGWKKIRNNLALSAGLGSVPVIRVIEFNRNDNTMILEHVYDGRELELNYAYETLKHVVDLWEGKVMLVTYIENKRKVILCDEERKITILNA